MKISTIAKVIECISKTCKLTGATVPAGRIFVYGDGVGDVGAVVLWDRKHLAQDGMIVVCVNPSSEDSPVLSHPDTITRGLVHVKESEDLMEVVRMICEEALNYCQSKGISDWATMKNALSNFLHKNTHRNPMILPVIMES